jgi:hypothetical protein
MYTRAVVHMQGSCACSAEVLLTCDASPACAPWQLETSEQKTTQVKAVEHKTKETKAEDGSGLLVKVDALREQAREVLVSAVRCRTSSLASAINQCRRNSPPWLLEPPPP